MDSERIKKAIQQIGVVFLAPLITQLKASE
jgi:hypothetical protein